MVVKTVVKILGVFIWLGICCLGKVNARPVVNPSLEPQYVYKNWNNRNGLPQNTVFDIAEDKDGFLWIATEEGLIRFDGNDFKIINEENTSGLFSSSFYDLSESSKEGVWAASGNTVLLVKNNTVKAFDFRAHVRGSWITRIAEDHGGKLWVGTNSGRLFYLENNSIIKFNGWTHEGSKSIQVLQPVSDGLLIGTDKGLLKMRSLDGNVFIIKEFESMNIRSLAVAQDGSIWVGTKENGLFHKTVEKTVHFTERDGLGELFVNSLSIDLNGHILIGTGSAGLQLLANEQFHAIEIKGFSDDIKSILVAEQGLIWLGTAGSGLIQLKPAEVQMLTEKAGLSGNIILPIYEHPNGEVWVGTAGSGVNRISNGKIVHYNPQSGLANAIVLSIYGTSEAVYLGTAQGLNRFNLKTGKIDQYFSIKDGLASNIIQAVFQDSDHTLWIATRAGGIHKLGEDGKIIRIGLPDKFSNAEFVSIFEDNNKNIWFGSNGSGIVRIDKNAEIKHYLSRQGLAANTIHNFYEDRDGTLWFGTEMGLACLVDNKFKLFNKSNGLKFNGIYRIIEDGVGYVWLSGNFGLQRISVEELENLKRGNAQIPVRLFDTSDGMANAEANGGIFPAGWKMKDGSLWFPTVEGIVIAQPKLIDVKEGAVDIHIQTMRFGNEEHTLLEDIVVPPGVYNIEIDYTSIDFTKPHTINYYYRLKGLDNEWTYAGNRRTAYFTSLDPGDYTFEVKAEQNGTWSETADLSFVVNPFFYQTTLFKAALFVLLFIAGFFVKRYHSNYKEEARLKTLVEERTKELKESNERLRLAIKDIESQNLKLKEIAWTQSHIVRAPLARMIGYINLIEEHGNSKVDMAKLLSVIKGSGLELDAIIRDIVKESEIINKDLRDGT
jgi:ligand-binding sensor domain-containing protein